jgi:hypothetical protein
LAICQSLRQAAQVQGRPHGFGGIPPYELYGAQEQLIWFRTYLANK